MRVAEHIRLHFLTARKVIKPKSQPTISLAELRKTEWSPDFERLMRNRLIMGAMRYGLLNAPGKPQYDRIASIRKRLDQYEQTGNDELLVDCANLLLCEFEEGIHPLKHFASVDDGEHVETAQE